jgi:methionyl-tRNA formyltransferase
VRIVFMGTPEFSVPIVRQLVLNGYQVVAVYTQLDKPAGRGRQTALSPVKRVALD